MKTLVVALTLLVAGCAAQLPPSNFREPRHVPLAALQLAHEPVALVLSGGSARGFAHVGVLEVLEENGLRPDIVVGSSAGALVGALYAGGLPAKELGARLGSFDVSTGGWLLWPRMGVLPGALGFVSSEGLRSHAAQVLPIQNIERFPMRFASVATDLDLGVAVAFNEGDAATAIEASMAVPVLFAPVKIGAHRFVDGQVASPVPVAAARLLGASKVIAIDVIYPPDDSQLTSAMRVMFQAFLISTYRLRELQLKEADFVLSPDIPQTSGQYGLGDREMLIEAGRRAARSALPALRRIMRAK